MNKVEVRLEWSEFTASKMFRVYLNNEYVSSHCNKEDAIRETERIKIAHTKKETEIIYTEEF